MANLLTLCLIGCVLLPACANVVKRSSSQVCLFEGHTYQVGDSFKHACTASCKCQLFDGQATVTCVSMCPPRAPSPGCTFEPNPLIDVANSLNCCDVEVCVTLPEIPKCVRNGEVIPEGTMQFLGTEFCGCINGILQCFPL